MLEVHLVVIDSNFGDLQQQRHRRCMHLQCKLDKATEMRINVASIAIFVITIVPLITFATTYALAFTRHDFPLHDAVPFLSLSISLPPESCIGTFGLVITANAASVLMVAKRYMQLLSFTRIAPSRLAVC